jgi:predicted GNAT family acetyltransferase
MLDDWFRTLRLKISFDEFKRLPRTLGYKHEYFDGTCVLTPRPRNCYAVLRLDRFAAPPACTDDEVAIRPLQDADWDSLGQRCGFAFHRIPPFDTLTDDEKKQAGRQCMEHTRGGGDGPLIAEASHVAVDDQGSPLGVLLIVLKPAGYCQDPWRNDHWRLPPAADAVAARAGQAHVNWLFVSPWHVGHGVASAMLAASVAALREMEYESLSSCFMLGNGESMAWHWRNGFELLPNPASMRYFLRRMKQVQDKPASGPAPPAQDDSHEQR